jgi:hypothetical protein
MRLLPAAARAYTIGADAPGAGGDSASFAEALSVDAQMNTAASR